MESSAFARQKTLSLTHVVYEEGNIWSQALALATLTPLFAMFCLAAAFAVTRRVGWAMVVCGALGVDGACVVLKHVIKQPRPLGSYRGGYGMPSEHAAFSVYCAVYFSLCVSRRVHCPFVLKVVAYVVLVAWAFLVILSRHHVGVHSSSQLGIGAALGAVAGFVWFLAESSLVAKALLVRAQQCVDTIWAWANIQYDDPYSRRDD
eukprot:TRINITY_DN32369_c0_g1_i1.p1 TRINITY_DN32369_c0_g1~~TRINITY_DN32369_c0_g1_i1.p1  ORF type:complete len:226 (-),score=26.02 TRINITY_DN32369_c0_g1_i1:102-716(-)